MRPAPIALALLFLVAPAALAAPCAGFTDVDDADPFCINVEWMRNRGITLGLTPTLYDPHSSVTRLQMAAFMYRLGFQNAFLKGGNAFGTDAVLGTTDNQPVEIHVDNARVMRYQPHSISPNIAGGHPLNSLRAGVRGATIAGGGAMEDSDPPPIFLEAPNRVLSVYGTVGGGAGNEAGDDARAVTEAPFATVGGGLNNKASGYAATVSGGNANEASGFGAFVGGGQGNRARGASAIALGHSNTADGDSSIAMGQWAYADEEGAFVFADNAFHAPFHASQPNSFTVRATGGVRLVVGTTPAGAPTWTCTLTNGNNWSCSSDRSLKQDLERLDGQAVLAKLTALPLYAWSPRGKNAAVRHYGPMAQDFHEAFGLGSDERMIGMQDADGVALAAIQGLNAKVDAERVAKEAEIAALRNELASLRALLNDALAQAAVR